MNVAVRQVWQYDAMRCDASSADLFKAADGDRHEHDPESSSAKRVVGGKKIEK
jgi:hypothetical protein